jgi:hypothetical protein
MINPEERSNYTVAKDTGNNSGRRGLQPAINIIRRFMQIIADRFSHLQKQVHNGEKNKHKQYFSII